MTVFAETGDSTRHSSSMITTTTAAMTIASLPRLIQATSGRNREIPHPHSSTPPGRLSRFRGPAVRLVLTVYAPGIQRVVHHHPVPQHLMILAEVVRQAQRDREQAWSFWRQVQTRGVRATHDDCELRQCRIGEVVLLQERVEAASLTIVR